jgi:nucleoside-diphosphate-sugar epimerase
MPAPISVLVTGSSGRIGRATPGLDDCIVGTLADRAALERAMRGIDCLIHLAATPDDVDDVLGQIVPNNIVGLYHVLEAAREAGVKRLILASSGQVNWWQQVAEDFPIRPTDPVSPKYWYAATKMFLEAIGRGFVEFHGISVIIARLGWCPRTRAQVEEIAASQHHQDVYFSPNDAGRFFACAVEAPETVRHAIVYGASKPLHKQPFDMSDTERLLGYRPEESWPTGIEVVQ